MTNRLTLAVALAAGLAGGMLAHYIAPPPVFAQAPAAPAAVPNEIRARSFVVVDQAGNTIGTFLSEAGLPGQSAHVVLRNPNGRDVPLVGGSMLKPLTAGTR